jgi:hypothetical protein
MTRGAELELALRSLEAERQTVIEPWQPSLYDLVRVRLNGECPAPHFPEEDGRMGVLDCIITQALLDEDNAKKTDPRDHLTLDRGHFYTVTWGRPRDVRRFRSIAEFLDSCEDGIFCAAELEYIGTTFGTHRQGAARPAVAGVR